jgi:CubicO group peptidase (beta-lactamase class C family)
MHRTTPTRVAVAASLALLGAACSDSDESADTTSAGTTTTSIVTEVTTESTDSTAAPNTSAPSTTPAIDDSDAIAATRALFASITPNDPGCTVAVSRNGEVVFAEAYGAARLDPLEPMTTDTVVDIGSTSKQFTATALLLLAERGAVDLDATLATYLPTLPGWAQQTTMRQIMHHQSGIPDYIGLLNAAGIAFTAPAGDPETYDVLGKVTSLEFEPGSAWNYSNSNYFLIAEVVEAVTGKDLGVFLDEEVFTPLGLDMVMDPAAVIPAKAVSYAGTGSEITVADSPWTQLGDGAIQTTPTELVRWATQYWEPTVGAAGINGARLEGAAQVPAPETGVYGAGIFSDTVDGIGNTLSHAGGWGGFVTAFAVAPEARVAVAATCTSNETFGKAGFERSSDLLAPWVTE